ncbi:hypothetical protein [Paenibacillus sp. RC84]|uniref:hypothetical protein n=1 Tax=Paenibacillus sp. RC84 TaxID=3156252 RepID=UPI0035191248
MKPREIANQLINLLKDVKGIYEQNENDDKYLNNEYTDLTHALEFLELDEENGPELLKQLQSNRRMRRMAKETNELLQPLYELATNPKGPFAELDRVLKKIQEVERFQSNRKYTARARTDMQEAFNRATTAQR